MSNLSFDELDIILQQKNGKIIHQIWFGTIPNKISSMYKFHTLQTFRESWIEKNPTFYYILWDKNMCRLFLKKYYNEYIDTFNNYEYEIQRCDFIRYFILYHYGGIYSDVDYYCCKSFEDIFKGYEDRDIYFVELPTGRHVSNSLIISKPKIQFWKKVFIDIINTNNEPWCFTTNLKVAYSTGNRFINRMYNKYENSNNIGKLPYIYFYPNDTTDIKLLKEDPKLMSYHLESESWAENDIFNIIYKESSIILLIIILLILPIIIRVCHN